MTDWQKRILESYMRKEDSGRYTSQDICDNLRSLVTLSVDEVSEHLISLGWTLQRDDERLVWTAPE